MFAYNMEPHRYIVHIEGKHIETSLTAGRSMCETMFPMSYVVYKFFCVFIPIVTFLNYHRVSDDSVRCVSSQNGGVLVCLHWQK
jgi:hypothetical protein